MHIFHSPYSRFMILYRNCQTIRLSLVKTGLSVLFTIAFCYEAQAGSGQEDPWAGIWYFHAYELGASLNSGKTFGELVGTGEMINLGGGRYAVQPEGEPEDAVVVTGTVSSLTRDAAYFEGPTEFTTEATRIIRIDDRTAIMYNTGSGFADPGFSKLWWSYAFIAVLERDRLPPASLPWEGDFVARHLSSSAAGLAGGNGYSILSPPSNVAARIIHTGNNQFTAKTAFEIGDIPFQQYGNHLEAGYTNASGIYLVRDARLYHSGSGRKYYIYSDVRFATSNQLNLLTAEWGMGIEMETNSPPIIVMTNPRELHVSMGENQTLSFEVQSFDPEGSNVLYHWTFNGQRAGETGNTYTHTTYWGDAGDHTLRCYVADNIWTVEHQIFTQWNVRVLSDNDDDGISNSDERHLYGSDPEKRDTDDDGMDDGDEITAGTGLTNPSDWFKVRTMEPSKHHTAPSLSWNSMPSRSYRVSASYDLMTWFVVHQTNGIVGRQTYTYPITTNAAAYLRVDVHE